MSLQGCFDGAQKGKFTDAEQKSLINSVNRLRFGGKINTETAERRVVQEMLDGAIAERSAIEALVREEMGLPAVKAVASTPATTPSSTPASTTQAPPAQAEVEAAPTSTKAEATQEPGKIDDTPAFSRTTDNATSWNYSQLARAIESAKFESAPAEQWKMWLAGNSAKLGVKKDEIQWTGINEYLDLQGKGKIAKADIAAYLEQNGVQVRDVMLKGETWIVHDGEQDNYFGSKDEALSYAKEIGGVPSEDIFQKFDNQEEVKFAAYQIHGGENYKELLLTLPEKTQKVWSSGRWIESHDPAAFRSAHYDQPNILAHVRFNERVDADGKRVLFIEEFQSDWGQKGKKEGFDNEAAFQKLIKERDAASDDSPARDSLQLQIDAMQRNGGKGVPSAPFVTDTKAWTGLALKRMIAYAADNNFSTIAWTTGAQQADRYSLSKQIDSVVVVLDEDGYSMNIEKDGGVVATKQRMTEQELSDNIGKDLAEKIVSDVKIGDAAKTYSGLDLTVGGSGMKGYYDQILPQVANEILKKIGGGKVGEVDIGSDKGWHPDLQEEVVNAPMVQMGFDITPSMREQVQSEGLPLFTRQAPDYTAPEQTPFTSKLQALQAASKEGASVVSDSNGGWLLTSKATAYTSKERFNAQGKINKLNLALAREGMSGAKVLRDAPTGSMVAGSRIARILGYEVTFIEPHKDFEGVSLGGQAFVSTNTRNPELGLIGHEVLHSLKRLEPDAYNGLAGQIRGYLKDGAVEEKRQGESKLSGREESTAKAEEEVLADLNGAMWLDPKFWNELAQYDPSLFRNVAYKFMEAVTKAMKSLGRFDAKNFVTDVDAVRTIIAKEWAAQARGAEERGAATDATNPDIRFSQQPIPEVPQTEGETLRALEWIAGGLTRDQMTDMYGENMPALIEYKQMQEGQSAARTRLLNSSDLVLRQLRKLPHKQITLLAEVAHEATLLGIDPAVQQSSIVHMEKLRRILDGLNQAEIDGTVLTDKQKALRDAAKARLDGAPSRIKEITDKYNLLSDDAKKAYAAARDMHKTRVSQVFAALEARIERMGMSSDQTSRVLKELSAEFDKLKSGVYFPLGRFGDDVVVAKLNGGSPIVQHFESEAKALKAVKAWRKQGYTAYNTKKEVYSKDFAQNSAVAGIVSLLRGADGNTTAPMADMDQLLDTVNQLLIQSLPDASYRHHFAHRKGTPGYSTDFIRTFSDSTVSSANHIASLEFSDLVTNAVGNMTKQAAKAPPGERAALMDLANHFKKREEKLKIPVHALSSALTQFGFVSALGSISAGILNLTQLGFATLPWVNARYGAAAGSYELHRAFGIAVMHITRAAGKAMTSSDLLEEGLDVVNMPGTSAPDKQMLSTLVDMDRINKTLTMDLISAANHPSEQLKNSPRAQAMRRIVLFASGPQHLSEVANRIATALAVFRLEMKKSGDYDKAVEQAVIAIDQTHFNYGAENRALLMMGSTARVITQFKQYGQNVMHLWVRNAYLSVKGKTAEERKIARKQIVWMIAMQTALAGTLGLPVGIEIATVGAGLAGFRYGGAKGAAIASVAALGAIALAAAFKDDEDDWESEYRLALAELLGKTGGEIVAKGIVRAFFVGDIASRSDQSELFIRKPEVGLEGKDDMEKWLTSGLGYTVGYAGSFATGAGLMAEGHLYRGLEQMIPFKQARDALKAGRYATEGARNLKGDDMLSEANESGLTAAEIATTVVGFNPRRVSEVSESNRAQMKYHRIVGEDRSSLLRRLNRAKTVEEKAEINAEISEFNEEHPDYKITPMTKANSSRAYLNARKESVSGIRIPKSKEEAIEQGNFANVN